MIEIIPWCINQKMVVCVCVYWANSPLSHDYDGCVELDVVEGGREEDLERHFVGPKKKKKIKFPLANLPLQE